MTASHNQGATLWQVFAVSTWVTHKVATGQSLNSAVLKAVDSVTQGSTAALKGAVQDLSFAAQRQRGLSDIIIARLIKKDISSLDPGLFALLRVVLPTLINQQYAKYDEHTAVNQAVLAVPCILAFGETKNPHLIDFKHPSTKNTQAVAGFINAVLRTFLREKQTRLANALQYPEAKWNHPGWWVAKLKKAYPSHWESLLIANNIQAPMTLRVNRRRLSVSQAKQLLHEAGIDSHYIQGAANALCLEKPIAVHLIPHFDQGWFSVQDAAAQMCADQLQLANGMRVLDACAAPGGKTGQLLESADIELTALDIDPIRIQRVQDNIDRIKPTLPDSTLQKIRLITCDAADTKSWWDGAFYDRIVLDAPCSGSGVVRRHPDIRWLRRESDIAALQKQQTHLLAELWQLLKPNGLLLYITCSVFIEEGEQQIRKFCTEMNHQSLRVKRLPSLGQILPVPLTTSSHTIDKSRGNIAPPTLPVTRVFDHDGFYYALLQKVA